MLGNYSLTRVFDFDDI